ncbi:kinase-like protein [Rhizophagus irregularis]|uniref:Kinase-like protein n=1 Tax=Rhizophagus irregularis TaxID=588596 RepID=A0A2N0RM23_9GLOM|nr:kinase-like protein [Rhizophagus irregularis]
MPNNIDASKFGKSGNANIDKFISEKKLKWIPYHKFEDVNYYDEGGFSTIYKAIWLNNNENKEVILKCHNGLNANLDEFLDEWKCHESCLNSYDIIDLYGFTKDPVTSNYMVIIDYANEGSLKKNLTKIINNNWKQKLYMLHEIISGLNEIHKQNLIHCDFHDGNILIHKDKKDEKNKADKIYICDLGLCRPVKSSLKESEIFGVMPFMAPEVLRGNPYTPASDIYSFSMIMWEFTSGVKPFKDEAHDVELCLSICKDELRPRIIENTPQCYVNLMKKCWSNDPLERPSALEVLNIIKEWIILPSKKKIEDINEELKCNVMEFINAPIQHNILATEITGFHPQAYYMSRLLDFTTKTLNSMLLTKDSMDYFDCLIED